MGRLLLIVGMLVALAGCPNMEEDFGPAVTAINQTDETLRFELFGAGEWRRLAIELPPGRQQAVLFGSQMVEPNLLTVDGCTEGDLVAYTLDGREVARRPPPLCDGDHWIIEDEQSPFPVRPDTGPTSRWAVSAICDVADHLRVSSAHTPRLSWSPVWQGPVSPFLVRLPGGAGCCLLLS
jgi:hypothetical protein